MVKVNQCFKGTCCLYLQGWRVFQARNQHEAGLLLIACFILVSCLAYSSALKMEVTCYSKMSVDFQWTTWHCIPITKSFHNHCWKNLKVLWEIHESKGRFNGECKNFVVYTILLVKFEWLDKDVTVLALKTCIWEDNTKMNFM
jgi:hypothetical protein